MPKAKAKPLNKDLLVKLMREASPPWNDHSLGNALGLADTTVRAWHEKDTGPNGDALIALCRILDVTPWELYGYQPTRAEAVALRINRLPGAARESLFSQIEIWLKGAEATSQGTERVHPAKSEEESSALLPRLVEKTAPVASRAKRVPTPSQKPRK